MAQQTVTNNHTLTAVEWLLEQLFNLNIDKGLSKRQYLGRRYKIEKEAIEMAKKQIKKAFEDGDRWTLWEQNKSFELRAEQYYNETYGK